MPQRGLGQREDFRTLFDRLPNVVLWTASEPREFDYVSDGFEDIWGIPAEKVQENFSFMIDGIHPDDREVVISFVQKSERELSEESFEHRVVHTDGTIRWVKAQLVPIRDDEGNLKEIVGVTTDITEQKFRESELRRQNERLDEFANIVSHDLRNPLNVAEGRLDLAQKECDSDHLEMVDHALERMSMLIDDLLRLAREGKSVEMVEEVDIADVVDVSWQNVETPQATIIVDSTQTIQADQSRLVQLFENLFRNSVEHSEGDVTITVGELENGFYVADDGPGIAESKRDQVFEYRYSTSDQGTGFGLAIVNNIVDAHGWDIRVTDRPEGGAQFEITGVEFAD